jgi:hypothetical protein
MLGIVEFAQPRRKLPQAEIDAWHVEVRSAVVCAGYGRLIQRIRSPKFPGTIHIPRSLEQQWSRRPAEIPLSQVEHAGEELSRARRSGDLQPNRAATWFNRDVEGQEPAALSLYFDDPRNRGQGIVGGRETDAVAVGEVQPFIGTTTRSPSRFSRRALNAAAPNVHTIGKLGMLNASICEIDSIRPAIHATCKRRSVATDGSLGGNRNRLMNRFSRHRHLRASLPIPSLVTGPGGSSAVKRIATRF